MKKTTVSDVVTSSHPDHVDLRKVYDSPHAMASVIMPPPGESLRKHITPVDVFIYTIEGEAVVEVEDSAGPSGGTASSKARPHPSPARERERRRPPRARGQGAGTG